MLRESRKPLYDLPVDHMFEIPGRCAQPLAASCRWLRDGSFGASCCRDMLHRHRVDLVGAQPRGGSVWALGHQPAGARASRCAEQAGDGQAVWIHRIQRESLFSSPPIDPDSKLPPVHTPQAQCGAPDQELHGAQRGGGAAARPLRHSLPLQGAPSSWWSGCCCPAIPAAAAAAMRCSSCRAYCVLACMFECALPLCLTAGV